MGHFLSLGSEDMEKPQIIFSFSSSTGSLDAGSSQPANGGREGMVLQHVLLVAGSISYSLPGPWKVSPSPNQQWGSECQPKARIPLDPLLLHVPLFSCPVWLIRASLGSVCVARSQLSLALLNRFASTET